MVLQVGAMKLEDNADVLAQELQKKNLPAFVFRHGPDGLYRVAVGPFSDEEATAKVKANLEKQGLEAHRAALGAGIASDSAYVVCHR